MRTLATLAALATLFASPLAIAQGPAASGPPPVTRYDENVWGETRVDGRRHTSDGEVIPGRVGARKSSLIRVRMHFHPELLETIENL